MSKKNEDEFEDNEEEEEEEEVEEVPIESQKPVKFNFLRFSLLTKLSKSKMNITTWPTK